MSDIKRIAFTTISEPKKPSDNNDKQVVTKTIRFDLNLFEPNADSFPELNYAKLLYLEKKKLKKITKLNGADPFEDLDNNDDEVAKIAKEFERKYGNNSSYVAASRPNNEYSDKGAGYDESDSFIDNTEAYDEIIPDEIETDRGGFYINSGALEFKHLSNFERPEDALRMPKPKKRVRELSTSEEEEDDDDNEEESTTIIENADNLQTEKKQKLSYDEMKKLKPYKDKTKDKKIEKSKNENEAKTEITIIDPEKVIKTTTVKDMLRAKRDNFRSMQEGNKSDTEDSEKESSSSISSDSSDEESSNFITIEDDKIKKTSATDNINIENVPQQRIPPDNLSDEIVNIIVTLKNCSTPNAAGKSTLFESKNSETFLKLESLTRSLSSKEKDDIYVYMASILSCSKEDIISEIKRCKMEQLENRVKRQLYKLKKAVGEIMPALITAHDIENAKLYEMRANLNNINDGEKIDFQMKPLRKRFQFNDNIRNLLYDVATTRKLLYPFKSKKESFEDYFENYLKSCLLPIWPNGWIRIDELNKELDKKKFSKKIHEGNNKKTAEHLTTKSEKVRNKLEPSLTLLTTNINEANKQDKTESTIGTTKLCNTTSSNLTITPVAGSLTTKTIQNIVSTSVEIPSNSSTNSIEQLKINNSNSNSNVNAKINYSSATQLPSSLSISISKHSTSNSSNNNSSAKNVSVNNSNSNTNVTKVSKTSENLTQTKRSSDYSINSIMSSSTTSNHTNKTKTSSSTSHSSSPKNNHSSDNTSSGPNKSGEKSSINNIKLKSDTAITTTTPITSPGTIKVRSVANMNESVLDNSIKLIKSTDSQINSLLTNNRRIDDTKDEDNNSDSSDGVELVAVFPLISKKPCVKTKTIINPNKFNKIIEGQNKNSNSSSSSSTSSTSSNSSVNSKSSETSNKSNTCKLQQYPIVLVKKHSTFKNNNTNNKNNNNNETALIDHHDISDHKLSSVPPMQPDNNKDDLDVNQIMNQIIELQELQQSKNCSASSTTPPTTASSLTSNTKNIKTSPSSNTTHKLNSNLQQNTTSNYIKVESTDHSSIMASEMEDVFHRHHHRTESPSSCQSVIDRSFTIPTAIGNYFTNPTSSQSCDFPHPALNTTTPLSSNFLISGMLNKISNYQSITQNNNSTINSELTTYNNNKPSS